MAAGDRVLVTFDARTSSIRRIVAMAAADIAKLHEADRLDRIRKSGKPDHDKNEDAHGRSRGRDHHGRANELQALRSRLGEVRRREGQ